VSSFRAYLGMVGVPVSLKVGVAFLSMLPGSGSHRLEGQLSAAMVHLMQIPLQAIVVSTIPECLVS